MNFVHLYTSLEGRIGRQTFWVGLVILLILQMIISTILASFGFGAISPEGAIGPGFWIGMAILCVIFLWPSICLYAKRYHDRDKSGWWQLIVLIPIIGIFWFIIECGFLKGTEGPNRFGNDPLA